MRTPCDPRLKEAMAEIKAVLNKHDIAGAITLCAKAHSEFMYEFPRWSVMWVERGRLRFRSKRKDFKTAKRQRETTEASVHVLLQARDIAGQTFTMMEQVEAELKRVMDVEHVPFSSSRPHRA